MYIPNVSMLEVDDEMEEVEEIIEICHIIKFILFGNKNVCSYCILMFSVIV